MASQYDPQQTSGQDSATHTQHRLLDAVAQKLGAKNDAALSRLLGVAPPQLSKIRRGRLPVGATMLLRLHEMTAMSIRELRALMTDDAPQSPGIAATDSARPQQESTERRAHR